MCGLSSKTKSGRSSLSHPLRQSSRLHLSIFTSSPPTRLQQDGELVSQGDVNVLRCQLIHLHVIRFLEFFYSVVSRQKNRGTDWPGQQGHRDICFDLCARTTRPPTPNCLLAAADHFSTTLSSSLSASPGFGFHTRQTKHTRTPYPLPLVLRSVARGGSTIHRSRRRRGEPGR